MKACTQWIYRKFRIACPFKSRPLIIAQLVGVASGGCWCLAPFAQSRASICVRLIGRRKRVQTENLGGCLLGFPLVAPLSAVGRHGRNARGGAEHAVNGGAESQRVQPRPIHQRRREGWGKGGRGGKLGRCSCPCFPIAAGGIAAGLHPSRISGEDCGTMRLESILHPTARWFVVAVA